MFTPYTANSLTVAYQLRWSLAIFPTKPLSGPIDWKDELSLACEPDGIRVLEVTESERGALLLLVSTLPHVTPNFIVQRVKGRLQYLLRQRQPVEWRRNFRLSTVGDANSAAVDTYIAEQLGHHVMASSAAQANLTALQWHDAGVDITKVIQSSHGEYRLGLHVVLVHAERWCQADMDFVELSRNTIRGVLADSNCPASRIAPLADHFHISLRLHYEQSPEELIIKMMNEVCTAHGGLRVWMNGYYAGTVGVYDMGAIRKQIPPSSPRW